MGTSNQIRSLFDDNQCNTNKAGTVVGRCLTAITTINSEMKYDKFQNLKCQLPWEIVPPLGVRLEAARFEYCICILVPTPTQHLVFHRLYLCVSSTWNYISSIPLQHALVANSKMSTWIAFMPGDRQILCWRTETVVLASSDKFLLICRQWRTVGLRDREAMTSVNIVTSL